MNTKRLAVLLAAGFTLACAGSALAGQATQATDAASQTHARTAAPSSTPAAPAKDKRAVPAPGSRSCIQSTGSHIPPAKGQCLPVAGNSYSQEDIRRTGAPSVGQALQMLDPSVTVRGH